MAVFVEYQMVDPYLLICEKYHNIHLWFQHTYKENENLFPVVVFVWNMSIYTYEVYMLIFKCKSTRLLSAHAHKVGNSQLTMKWVLGVERWPKMINAFNILFFSVFIADLWTAYCIFFWRNVTQNIWLKHQKERDFVLVYYYGVELCRR